MSPSPATAFRSSLSGLSAAFTAPSFVTFEQLIIGWVLRVGRHTVTGVLQASGALGTKHHTSFHRFFRHARWEPEQVGLLLLRLVVAQLAGDATIVVPLDDTLSRHTGKRIAAASMHHDPLLSTRTRAVSHWGHIWVVLSIAIRVPSWGKTFALPVLVRLYRSEKLCKKERRRFKKKTELAAEMIAVLAKALPTRRFLVLGDAAYANASIIRTLPGNVHFTGRARLDAALYALPLVRNPRGRRRIKGERLATPEALAKRRDGWQRVQVTVHGKTVNLRVKTIDALWYKVGRGRLIRIVVVRGWPGHDHDDALCTTDLCQDAKAVIESYCTRWSLEVTFHEAKGKLGLEDAQNRTNRAVERTTPMALWTYTLVVIWFLTTAGTNCPELVPQLPWYRKQAPAFSDMLASLRRALWTERLLALVPKRRDDQKSIEPLLNALAYAA